MTKEKTDEKSVQDASKENDAAASKAAQQQSHATDGDDAKEQAAREADAAAARTRQATAEAEGQQLRGGRPQDSREPANRMHPEIKGQESTLTTVGRIDTPEGVLAQHDQVQAENDRRNERNREGHERNMKLEEARAEEAHARTEHFQDARAGHVPTGRQRDVNTPDILPDGTKVWRS